MLLTSGIAFYIVKLVSSGDFREHRCLNDSPLDPFFYSETIAFHHSLSHIKNVHFDRVAHAQR